MTPQDRIKKAHVQISMDKTFCAYSALLATGKTTVSPDHGPTACTDGVDTFYNPTFVESLDDAQLRLLVLHENTHKAYQHLRVWRDLWSENAKLANIAMDHFVNLSLLDSDKGRGFLKMPAVGVQPDPKYRGLNVKQIFDLLKQNPPPQGNPDSSSGGDGEAGDGLDSHDFEGASKRSPAEVEQIAKDIEHAVRQGEALQRMRGKGRGDANGTFGDLLTPKADWRKLLRQFIQTYCAGKQESTWRKPNRRFLADPGNGDTYMPTLQGQAMGRLLVGFDTSGSCFGTADMTRFVTELTSIATLVKPSEIHVVYCDWEVQGHQIFKSGQFATQALKPRGGGGTDLTKIFRFADEQRIKPQAAVILTDLATPFGQPPGYPVLWASNYPGKAPWGVTVSIE